MCRYFLRGTSTTGCRPSVTGFAILYLGADVPTDALLEACLRHRPAVLGLGVTMPGNVATLNLTLARLVTLGDPPAVILGREVDAPWPPRLSVASSAAARR
jgi:methanogenic corrinoid protein MtbC1